MSDARKMFEEDFIWIDDHWNELFEAYGDQWIAVKDKKVIANAIELNDLRIQLDDPAHTAVEFIEGRGSSVDRY